MSLAEYVLSVPEDDWTNGLQRTKQLVRRMTRRLLRIVGSIRFRITIDAVMERFVPPVNQNEAGFRSTLKQIPDSSHLDEVLTQSFNQLEKSVETYNRNGMSGSRLKTIKQVRVLVVT